MNEAVSGSRFHEPAPGVLEQTREVGGAGLILHIFLFQGEVISVYSEKLRSSILKRVRKLA